MDSIQNCYTYECAITFYNYMSLTLINISHKLEKWEANELSHHCHQLLQPSGQSAVLPVSMDLYCTPSTLC